MVLNRIDMALRRKWRVCTAAVVLACLPATAFADITNKDVEAFQSVMKKSGIYSGPIDGSLNHDTKRAIQKVIVPLDMPKDEFSRYVRYALQMRHNRHEWEMAQRDNPQEIEKSSKPLPLGTFRIAYSQGGKFSHILHSREIRLLEAGLCQMHARFENTSTKVVQDGYLEGSCSRIRWRNRKSDSIMFWAKHLRGEVWTAETFFKFLVSAGNQQLPWSMDMSDDERLIDSASESYRRVP